MRKIIPAGATALALSLLLTGCGASGWDSVKLSAEPSDGKAPSVSFETPLKVDDAQTKVLKEGDGPDIDPGDSIMLQAALYKGSDGSSLGETYSQGAGQVLTVNDQLKDSLPQMYDALTNAKEGAIIAYSSPETSGKAGDGDDSTSVEVYHVTKKLPAALNEKMSTPEKGMPEVTQDDKGTPTIKKPSGSEPTTLKTDVLIQGDGETVKSSDTVVANYVGVRWADGKAFDSSYEKGTPVAFPLDNVIAGWKEGLAGKKVGSRVEIVVPVDKAYGTAEKLGKDSQYPAGALVFVVDILARTDTPAQATQSPSASPSASAAPQGTATATPSAKESASGK
ncbi:FKBP-type peptidyl-prolyl cis-trans isomerase [Kocuria sp.]|uniref:FKBP-type peptidyl-prolyl cis-trans isomerase n=1 Tax=Kocuria sp. TaxID=1871328 RepID=UPI0026DB8DA4|nr:FKBP-type peptidyl-prolyl cis-trans isomerase [Kocuria sp.]MDO4919494.1 FKBP-type peptidyl-prolyl cis-trans isomerase [Kocuria sp.]